MNRVGKRVIGLRDANTKPWYDAFYADRSAKTLVYYYDPKLTTVTVTGTAKRDVVYGRFAAGR